MHLLNYFKNSTATTLLFRLVQIATIGVFLGRAWQHWRWDAPYRTLLWDEYWMSPIVSGLLSWNWMEYVQSPAVDQFIQGSIRVTGLLYLLCGMAALFIKKLPRFSRILLWLGAVSLILLALLYCKERFFSVGQFFEYSLQCGSTVSYTHLRAHETREGLVCRLLLEKKKEKKVQKYVHRDQLYQCMH